MQPTVFKFVGHNLLANRCHMLWSS